jgi:hypothetical protein
MGYLEKEKYIHLYMHIHTNVYIYICDNTSHLYIKLKSVYKEGKENIRRAAGN